MKSVGIIAEYNPFHDGHLYHLSKIKELYPDHTIILVMSGAFTQRGDVSIIDKWKKTEIAKKAGIDLKFQKVNVQPYPQRRGPENIEIGLSIIDVMMFNSPEEIKEMLNNYELI